MTADTGSGNSDLAPGGLDTRPADASHSRSRSRGTPAGTPDAEFGTGPRIRALRCRARRIARVRSSARTIGGDDFEAFVDAGRRPRRLHAADDVLQPSQSGAVTYPADFLVVCLGMR